jgi:hypothetical protein
LAPFAGLFGFCWGLARVGWLARLRGDWPPAIGRLFGLGLAPVGLAGLIGPGVCWGWLARAIGPGLIGRGWCNWGGLARLLGAIGGGLQRLGRVGWPPLIGAGLAPGRLGGAGRLAPDHVNPGGLCNDFPVILHFL